PTFHRVAISNLPDRGKAARERIVYEILELRIGPDDAAYDSLDHGAVPIKQCCGRPRLASSGGANDLLVRPPGRGEAYDGCVAFANRTFDWNAGIARHEVCDIRA